MLLKVQVNLKIEMVVEGHFQGQLHILDFQMVIKDHNRNMDAGDGERLMEKEHEKEREWGWKKLVVQDMERPQMETTKVSRKGMEKD